MKHNQLVAIAHNAADSLASGCSMLTGIYDGLDVYADAGRSPDGVIVADFLNGAVIEGRPSHALKVAVSRIPEALRTLCAASSGSIEEVRHLTVRYWSDITRCPHLTVTLEDNRGRRSSTEYAGLSTERARRLDPQGRLRPKPSIVAKAGG